MVEMPVAMIEIGCEKDFFNDFFKVFAAMKMIPRPTEKFLRREK